MLLLFCFLGILPPVGRRKRITADHSGKSLRLLSGRLHLQLPSMPAASSSLISHLFPSATFSLAFTTADLTDAGNEQQISQVELSDPALGVHKTSSRHPHNVVIPPPPSTSSSIPPPQNAWEAVYPKGSINPSGAIFGGFGFYLSGPPDFAKRLESANEVVMSYRVMFEDGWEWVKGGKIPGICESLRCVAYERNCPDEVFSWRYR